MVSVRPRARVHALAGGWLVAAALGAVPLGNAGLLTLTVALFAV
jgi:hypothetical protein